MSKTPLFARAGLAVIILATTTINVSPSFADEAAASSAAGGTVSANSSDTGSPPSTTSDGSVSFGTGTQASGDDQGGGTASANSHATASAGAGSISLSLSSDVETSVSSTGGDRKAIVDSASGGSIGSAHIVVVAHADATSGPDQLTASATANDGSYALAEKGIVNGLKSFVPGGVTQILYNGSSFQSVSCNASGTCSSAIVANDSVSAGIRIFASTGTIDAGNVNAILNAFLSVEARAGWSYVSAAATSNINGTGNSNGLTYSANVSANIGTSGDSRIWRVTSVDNVKGGAVSARVWLQGENICASTKVHLRHSQHGMTKIVKCRHLKKNRMHQSTVLIQQSHKNWLTKLFSSKTALRN